MEYNTSRPNLKIPEYGRNVQKMVEHLKTLPTKEERSQAANSIISVMVALNPQLKEQSEYKQKLWDHLFLIGNYDLDIDSPFPPPTRAEMEAPPQKPEYASNHIKYRYYGKNVERMIKHAIDMPEGPMKDNFVNALASYMKMAYRMWNEEKVPDEVILKHLVELSHGKLQLDSIYDLTGGAAPTPQRQNKEQGGRQQQQHRHNKNQGGGNNKRNFRRN